MGKNITFICPDCLMGLGNGQAQNRGTDEGNRKKLNSITDIAYSMPDELFRKMCGPLEAEHRKLTLEMNEKRDLICCITWDDINDCLENTHDKATIREGTYRLTTGWLKKNAERFDLTYEEMETLPDDMILLEEKLKFYYEWIDGYRFPKKIRNGEGAGEEGAKLLSDERRCARCGRLLSPDTGKAPEVRILLQGSSRAGKTSCIIALFDYLLKQNIMEEERFRAQLANGEGPDKDEVEHYHNWIKRELKYYRNGYKVEKTDTTRDKPIVYSLLVKVDDRELVLSFVDMPGEYFDKADKAQQDRENLLKLYLPIYEHCDVVWTCLRYETLVSDMERSPEQWKKLEDDTGLTEVLASFAEYDRYYYRFSELIGEFESHWGKEKKPKHAAILTMTDSIVSVYNPPEAECRLMRENHIIPDEADKEKAPDLILSDKKKRMVFQERACHNLCRRVSAYVRGKNSNLHKLFAHFSKHTKYFAIAAYGHPAEKRPADISAVKEKGKEPVPYQCEAPLLWTLAVCGYLPIEYTATCYRKLGWWERYREQKTEELVGERRYIHPSIDEADDTARDNLLYDYDEYQNHTVTLGRGEPV